MVTIRYTTVADLSMNGIFVSVANNAAGVRGYLSQATIRFRVRNTGETAANSFRVQFYYGDTTSTAALTALTFATVSVPANSAGSFLSHTVTLPSNVLNGTRRLHYFIDSTGIIRENLETNNRSSSAISINALPDIFAFQASVSPTTQAPGGSLTVTYRFYNLGYARVPSSFLTRFYFSTDNTITTGDTLLRQITSPPFNARSFSPAGTTTTVTVPAAAPIGTRYIGVFADYNNAINETNNNNNTRAAAFTVSNAAPS